MRISAVDHAANELLPPIIFAAAVRARLQVKKKKGYPVHEHLCCHN
jgi:hypothetical protein